MEPFITFSCRCGAGLQAPIGVDSVGCYHCRSIVDVPQLPPPPVAAYPPPPVAAYPPPPVAAYPPPPVAAYPLVQQVRSPPPAPPGRGGAVLTQLVCLVAGFLGVIGLSVGDNARGPVQQAVLSIIQRLLFDHAELWLLAGAAGFLAAAFAYRRGASTALAIAAAVDGLLAIETFRLLGRVDDVARHLRAIGAVGNASDDYSGAFIAFGLACVAGAVLCALAIPKARAHERWLAAAPPASTR